MRKTLFSAILFLSVAIPILAQERPTWADADYRKMSYPASEYFTGTAIGTKSASETTEAALARIKDGARIDALSSIQIFIQNDSRYDVISKSVQQGGHYAEQIEETMSSSTRSRVEMTVPGLKVEAWKNPANNEIIGFAYVKKSTLRRQLEKQIMSLLAKAETALDNADELKASGQKMQARTTAEKAAPLFIEIEQTQRLLIAVDADADAETLQLDELRDLQQRFIRTMADLKNGINIYINCSATLFTSPYPTLLKELQGDLSALGCNFINDAATSDWAIYINATAREYNKADFGTVSTYTVYTDAAITIDKTSTQQRVYEDELHQKGVHTLSYTEAAREAYKDLTKKISTIIKQQIQQ